MSDINKRKEKRINRVRKQIKEVFFENSADVEAKNIRTMKCKVITEDEYNEFYKDSKKHQKTSYISKEMQEKLDKIIEYSHSKREEVLKDLMKKFYENPLDIIEMGAGVVNITKNNIKLEKVSDAVSICKFVYKETALKKDKDGNDKTTYNYFTSNIDLENTDEVENNKQKLKKENNTYTLKDIKMIKVNSNYEIGGFVAKTMYGKLYTDYKKDKDWDYKIGESVLFNLAKEMCSFLDKYYTIQAEIQKTIKENNELLEQQKDKLVLNDFIDVNTKEQNDNYNLIVSQNNIKINLYEQQLGKKELTKEECKKLELEFFKRLKGFPSFPLVEKRKELNYSDLDTLLKKHIESTKEFFKAITKEQLQEVLKHLWVSKGNVAHQLYKMLLYYYKAEVQETNITEHNFILKSYTTNDCIGAVLERIDKKISTLSKAEKTDLRSQKAHTEWYRGKSLLCFEYLRQTNHEEFAKVRSKFNKASSVNTGIFAKDKIERKVLEITGFSADKKKAAIFVDNYNYALAFNFSGKKENSEFKITEKGFVKGYVKGKDDKIELKSIDYNGDGTIILPLAMGKRQGREFLHNFDYNFANQGETLNNARIIQETDKKGNKEYYIAITFTKLKGNDNKKFDNTYEKIIGVDRGEALPVVLTITDLQGKKIETIIPDCAKDFAKKQKEINDEKEKRQSETGSYDKELKKKAKHLAETMVSKVGAELLYYATEYKALIVFENLNREFGVSPIMAKRQYSKVEDFLVRKLKENGLGKGGEIFINTRSGLFGKVNAQYTSKTCSSCGHVFDKASIKALVDNIYCKNDIWYVEIDGKEIPLNVKYEYYVRAKGRNETSTAEETNKNIGELKEKLKEKNTKTIRESLEKILLKVMNPRKTQSEFICPICEHVENADWQASLNIARKWIFEREGEVRAIQENNFQSGVKYKSIEEREKSKTKKKGKTTEYNENPDGDEGSESSIKYIEAWQSWYKEQIEMRKSKNNE